MSDDLIVWLRAQLDDDEALARDAAVANPGAAADVWSAEKIDHKSGIDGAWHKTWAVVPERVRGIVLAVCAADILPRVVSHIARHDPARVLREVAAKRAILDEHHPGRSHRDDRQPVCAQCRKARVYPCLTVRLLASVYADRPGYRDEMEAARERT